MPILVIGPPAAGKSTWVRGRAKRGDLTIDFDTLAGALSPCGDDRDFPEAVVAVTKAARLAAVDAAVEWRHDVDVYLVHALPERWLLDMILSHGGKIAVIDPGEEIVTARCKAERSSACCSLAEEWYRDRSRWPRQRVGNSSPAQSPHPTPNKRPTGQREAIND